MSREILELCDTYYKVASEVSKISLVENHDPILREISEMDDFDDRMKLAKDKFELLGEGSARAAFQVNKDLVLKLATSEKGLAQNQVEAQPKLQKDCTCPIIAADAKFKWLLVASNESITEKRFKEITGMSFQSFHHGLTYKFNNNSDDLPPKHYEEIEANPFFRSVAELVFDGDLLCGDLEKISSYGEINGKVVVRDSGLDKDTFRFYYDHNGSSSSSASSSSR